QGQCALSSGLYRLAGPDAELSRRRPAELRGSRRRGASFGDRLSGRRAMERGRRGKGVVRAGEIPPVVPPAAERMAGGRAGVKYGSDENPLALLQQRTRGAISAYAQGDDYHDVIKKRLKMLARWLVAASGEEVKVFIDTAAVMEKPLAQAAGLGWQGKHTNLVSREFGSWLLLGAIFTASDLPRDAADTDHCGSCNACQEICPTAAFPAPYKLDARRCISYLTIENKGPIPHEFRKSIGNRIYGCDDCLAVCPWNKFAQEGREAKLAARSELRAPSLVELARLDDAAFRALFSKSPVKRIGRDRFVRNVLIA